MREYGIRADHPTFRKSKWMQQNYSFKANLATSGTMTLEDAKELTEDLQKKNPDIKFTIVKTI